MMPIHHLWTSLLLAAVLYPFFGLSSFIVVISGVLIDIDHYIFDYFKYNRPSPLKWYKFHDNVLKKREFNDVLGNLYLFHTLEFFLLVGILSFFNKYIMIAFIGMLLHRTLDIIQTRYVSKYFSVAAPSLILWLYHRKLYKASRMNK